MKKIISYFSYALLAMASMTFVACDDDDDDNEAGDKKELNEESTYARLVAKVTSEALAYGDFIVTLEYDGTSQTYKMSEATLVDSLDLEVLSSFDDPIKIPGRVLSIPTFEYKNKPVKLSFQYEFSEDGKQQIANATEDDKAADFGYNLQFGSCSAEGIFLSTNPTEEFFREICILRDGPRVKTVICRIILIQQ